MESLQNRLLKVCYEPATSPGLPRLLLFLLWPLQVLMIQTRQAVHAIEQSILLRCLWDELPFWPLKQWKCNWVQNNCYNTVACLQVFKRSYFSNN